jgi:menaquinone-9 beta-reductase
MADRYDALIVGARAAGAATALLLARAGARVLVVERDAPGTDTLSTHALMRGGVQQLARWGLLDRVVAAGTPPVRTTLFAYGTERVTVAIKPRQGIDALYSPRRTVLDPILAGAAIEAGAIVRYHSWFVDVLRGGDGRVQGALVRTDEGLKPIRAGIVIGADGRRSRLARAVSALARHVGLNAAASVYAYVAGIADRGNRWHYAPGAAAGVIPTNDGLHVVFVGVPPGRFRAAMRGDLAPALHRTLAEVDPDLAAEVAAGRPASRPLAFAGEPGWLRAAHGPGWALVGDAGYFKDPITAHGLTDALRDAELLAAAVLAGSDRALAGYEATRDALSLPLFRATDAIAALPADMGALQARHRDLHEAMRAEQDWLAAALPAAA